ncbi:MAG: hypothetical protein M3417_11320, partial [Actinomycetota bacterium]|nr:hypothetical protein [Actinomycetota bacterium]
VPRALRETEGSPKLCDEVARLGACVAEGCAAGAGLWPAGAPCEACGAEVAGAGAAAGTATRNDAGAEPPVGFEALIT